MAEHTKIEWADDTFNPWTGCTKVSPACDHCYAEGWAKRTGQPQLWTGDRRRTSAAYWRRPLKWNREAAASGKPRRVFCASLADVFDNQVPVEWRWDLWSLVRATPHLTWMLLTKRPQNIAKMLPFGWRLPGERPSPFTSVWSNVWLGTTAENQIEWDRRLEHLARVPAVVHFASVEPMLGFIDCGNAFDPPPEGSPYHPINWVICGGESGPGARPMHPDWARSLRDQCAAAGVPFHFKQRGEWAWIDDADYDSDRIPNIPLDWREHPERVKCVRVDGSFADGLGGDTAEFLIRVGKRRAGRLLDGREWNEVPRA